MQDKHPSIDDIAIPETVEVAIMKAWNEPNGYRGSPTPDIFLSCIYRFVKVTLHSLACDPVIPSDADSSEMYQHATGCIGGSLLQHRYMLTEWQRRMFLRKPDPVPQAVKSLLVKHGFVGGHLVPPYTSLGLALLDAHRLGKEARDAE